MASNLPSIDWQTIEYFSSDTPDVHIDFAPYWTYQQTAHHYQKVEQLLARAKEQRASDCIKGVVFTLLMVGGVVGVIFCFMHPHMGGKVGLGTGAASVTLTSFICYVISCTKRANLHDNIVIDDNTGCEDEFPFPIYSSTLDGITYNWVDVDEQKNLLHIYLRSIDNEVVAAYAPVKAPWNRWNLLGPFARPKQYELALAHAENQRDVARENARTWCASLNIQDRINAIETLKTPLTGDMTLVRNEIEKINNAPVCDKMRAGGARTLRDLTNQLQKYIYLQENLQRLQNHFA